MEINATVVAVVVVSCGENDILYRTISAHHGVRHVRPPVDVLTRPPHAADVLQLLHGFWGVDVARSDDFLLLRRQRDGIHRSQRGKFRPEQLIRFIRVISVKNKIIIKIKQEPLHTANRTQAKIKQPVIVFGDLLSHISKNLQSYSPYKGQDGE